MRRRMPCSRRSLASVVTGRPEISRAWTPSGRRFCSISSPRRDWTKVRLPSLWLSFGSTLVKERWAGGQGRRSAVDASAGRVQRRPSAWGQKVGMFCPRHSRSHLLCRHFALSKVTNPTKGAEFAVCSVIFDFCRFSSATFTGRPPPLAPAHPRKGRVEFFHRDEAQRTVLTAKVNNSSFFTRPRFTRCCQTHSANCSASSAGIGALGAGAGASSAGALPSGGC